jgi:hypothetical protein
MVTLMQAAIYYFKKPALISVLTLTKISRVTVSPGQCYDHQFQRFMMIFGEKMAFFFKTNAMVQFLYNLAVF